MDKVQLHIDKLEDGSEDFDREVYYVYLNDSDDRSTLQIQIGTSEAEFLSMAIEGMNPSRPTPYDLILDLAKATNMVLQEVVIYRADEFAFYSKLLFEDEEGFMHEIESRTSDAMTLATLTGAEIFAESRMFYSRCVRLGRQRERFEDIQADYAEMDNIRDPEYIAKLSDDELRKLSEKWLKNEEYELVALCRAELLRRRKGDK
jgi:bifunctional DNase/RNase